MPDYRRKRIPGGTYFFTVNLRDRRSDLLIAHRDALGEVVRATREQLAFSVDAVVLLPDHMHWMWTLPAGDSDFSTRWGLIKAGFAKLVPYEVPSRASLRRKRESGIWQRRFWEHTIRDGADYAAHMDYIHFNPVRHGYVSHARDWPHSSFARCVARGLYPADWAEGAGELVVAGERD